MYDPGYDGGGMGAVGWLLILGIYFYLTYSQYKIAQKVGCADRAWWAFIPIANTFLLIKMANKESWWFVLCLVPLVNIICFAILWMETAKAAGHSPLWGFLVLVPFLNFVAIGVMAFSGYSSDVAMPMSGQIEKREPTQVV
jgi:signal peptidase I